MTTIKPDDSSCFYFINPNGFQLNASGGTFAEICAEAKRISADHIGVSEHKLVGHQSRVKKICHNAARRKFDHHRLVLGSSDIPTDTYFKPGGTLSLTIGSMTARIKSAGFHPLGRWSYTKFVRTREKSSPSLPPTIQTLPTPIYRRPSRHVCQIQYPCPVWLCDR